MSTKVTDKPIEDGKSEKGETASEGHVDVFYNTKALNRFYSSSLSLSENKLFIKKIINGVQYCKKNMDSLTS